MSLLRRAATPPPPPAAAAEVTVAVVVDVGLGDVGLGDVGLDGGDVDGDQPRAGGQRAGPGAWGELARAVLVGEGTRGPAELALSFVDEATIAALNEEWMGEEGPTDVLSFPIDPDPGEGGGEPGGAPAPRLLGDVVICPAVARRYAVAHGRRPADELALLVVHGVLHVLGHDHGEPGDAAAMHARELHHLRAHHDPAWTQSTS